MRFVQTAGGRTGTSRAAPRPRASRSSRSRAPLAWTTLALTINADGSRTHELVGASPFPRHWIYDKDGKLIEKSGMIDFKEWYREAFGKNTPWGDEDSPAFVTDGRDGARARAVTRDHARGRSRSRAREGGRHARPSRATRATSSILVLDGVLAVEVDGETVGELGPGAILGERAVVESGSVRRRCGGHGRKDRNGLGGGDRALGARGSPAHTARGEQGALHGSREADGLEHVVFSASRKESARRPPPSRCPERAVSSS